MYEIYHSNKNGNILATSRSKKDVAIDVAKKITLKPGESVRVLRDRGDKPGDYDPIYRREFGEEE